MSTENKTSKTCAYLRVSPELHKHLRHEAFDKGMTVGKLLEKLLKFKSE